MVDATRLERVGLSRAGSKLPAFGTCVFFAVSGCSSVRSERGIWDAEAECSKSLRPDHVGPYEAFLVRW